MNDLFLKPLTMRQRVIDYCKQKGFVTSVDIENLKDHIRRTEGNVSGLLRIHREWRALAKSDTNPNGLMRRLDDREKVFRGFKNTKIATYEWTG